ncbi:MAG: thrombospondin type 3 repeat-containing protein [Myxococcota bacterium]|nr:thrombospondin type 3 repeat-containing protein [Myxococcota bacterium]
MRSVYSVVFCTIVSLGCSADTPPADPEPEETLRRFQDAVEAQDLATLRGLFADEHRAEVEKLIASDPSPLAVGLAFLPNVRLEDQRVGPTIVEGERAVVPYEGFGDLTGSFEVDLGDVEGLERAVHEPIRTRVYGRTYLVRENGSWKISATALDLYADPRALYKEPGGDGISEWGPGHHCAFRREPSSCGEIGLCWECFAKLRMDPALCDQVERHAERVDSEFFRESIAAARGSCRIAVARLVGDPSICEKVPDVAHLGRSLRQECLGAVESHDFLASQHVFLVDSDGDGLTDRMERFFNTSIFDPDSDADGVSDAEEVAAMTNPLGPGRLGDHLR